MAFLSLPTFAGAPSWVSEYHLIVSGELQNVAEVEGRAVVNHVTDQNSFNVGINYSSDPAQIDLAIGGNLVMGGLGWFALVALVVLMGEWWWFHRRTA